MKQWVKPVTEDTDEVIEFDIPDITFVVTDNPVVGELLGPHGEVIRQVLEREPIGYRKR